MPDIEVHGSHDLYSSENYKLQRLFEDAPYAADLTLSNMGHYTPACLLMTGKNDPFLRVYASTGWLGKHRADLLARLTPHYGVEIVPIEWHPKKAKLPSAGGGPVTVL